MAEVYPSYALALSSHLASHGRLRCHAIGVSYAGIDLPGGRYRRAPVFKIWLVELSPLKSAYGYRVKKLFVEEYSWGEKKAERMAKKYGDYVGRLNHLYSPERFAKSVLQKLGIEAEVAPPSLSRLLPWLDVGKLSGQYVVQMKVYRKWPLARAIVASIPDDEASPERLRRWWLTPIGAIGTILVSGETVEDLIEDLLRVGACDRKGVLRAIAGREPEASLLYLAIRDSERRFPITIL